jgi:predicted nucleotidyltransferase
MNPQRHIARLLQRAAHDADILAIMLYGSAARGDASARWDVDVCLLVRLHDSLH